MPFKPKSRFLDETVQQQPLVAEAVKGTLMELIYPMATQFPTVE